MNGVYNILETQVIDVAPSISPVHTHYPLTQPTCIATYQSNDRRVQPLVACTCSVFTDTEDDRVSLAESAAAALLNLLEYLEAVVPRTTSFSGRVH